MYLWHKEFRSGSGGYGGGSSSSGGYHGGGGGSNSGANTAPVVPCTRNCPDLGVNIDPNTPCGKLKKQLDTPSISNALNTLRNNVNLSDETAFSFSKNASGQVTPTPQTNSSGSQATVSISNTTFGIAHTHPEGPAGDPTYNFPVFAPMDLIGIAKAIYGYTYPVLGETPLFYNMMVVNGVTYAVTPNDPSAFVNLNNILFDMEMMKDMNENLQNICISIASGTEPHLVNKDKLAKAFLEFMNSTNNPAGTNFDVSLYKIDDSNLASKIWSKVELDPTKPNGIKNTPCN